MTVTEKGSSYDESAKKSGLMVGISKTLYMWSVSPYSTAYMEYYNDAWNVWRETYQSGRGKAVSVKTIASGNTFEYTLGKFKNYMSFIKSKRR